MREDIRKVADLLYLKILGPGGKINIHWLWRAFQNMGIKDESLEKLASLNAPLSREVWYYAFLRAHEEDKLHTLLNKIIEVVGAEDVDRMADSLKNIGIYYQHGSFKRRVFKLVVLVSGRGTNLQAIIDAIKNRELNARIVAVISNKKKAYALKRAEKNGIEAIYLPAKKGESREDYDKRLAQIIDEKEPNLIVLAGFMRILSPWFVRKYPNKIINIHPALLPSFAGLYGENVHRAVIEYGCKVSGCTVHFVDEEVDHGPIIVQKCVEVKDDDTPQSLASRILEREHEALVEAIRLISEGRVKIVGRRVIIS